MELEQPEWFTAHEELERTTFASKEDLQGLRDDLNKHMEELKPFMQGAAGLGLLWKVLMAVGGVLVIWVQIKGYLTGH